MKDWICTDPDNGQYRLDEGQNVWKDKEYTFKQDDQELTINLTEYTLDEINDIINAFGYRGINNPEPYYFIDGTDEEISLDIIAECIFESEIGVV